jgi:hypothetical protein
MSSRRLTNRILCWNRPVGLMLLLTLAAFAVRLYSIWSNLPDVPNPDEYMLVWPPLRIAYGTWYASGGYPPLHMYVLLGEYGILYTLGAVIGQFAAPMDFAVRMLSNPTPLYLVGRVTSVLLGTASVWLLYAVGRRLYDERTGLLAAAFLAFDTVHVYASQVVKNDVLLVFLLLLCSWFSVGILTEGRGRHYLLAGLSAGLAAAAKYNGAIAIFPILVAHLLRSRAGNIGLFRALLLPLLWLAGLCTLVGFLLGNPTFLLDPGFTLQALGHNSVDFFWDWLGYEGAPLGWIYYPFVALNIAWGIPLQVLALTGFVAAWVRHKPGDLLMGTLPLMNYLMMGAVRVNQPRYFLLGMPLLLLLGAKLLVDAWEWAQLRLPARLQRIGLPLVAALLVAWPAGMSLFQDHMLLQPNPRVTARGWIEENVPSGSRVVVDMVGPQLAASPESLLEYQGPPRGRFEEVRRQIAADRHPSYWVQPIRHYVRGEDYRQGREATVQPLALYRAEGYDYVVTSTHPYNSYLHWPGVAERYPQTMAFYDSLAQEAELLAVFRPAVEDPRDFTITDLDPIPAIRVYALHPQRQETESRP